MNQIGNTPMMARYSLRLSQEEREQIEQYAARHSMTISEAVRDILERHVKEQSK